LLKPTIDRLLEERIKEEHLDALYRYRVHSDPARLRIHPTAVVNNAIFNTGGGHITVGEYVLFGHNVCVLAGRSPLGRVRPRLVMMIGVPVPG
jgi:hypothetical protein